ncbi:MAG: pyruvate ferredoxin oxidoreductase [Candidatus Neomarinimicrobiota bacterium]|nr:MAG: pyruvate ferredoxin oxidoreductase [Candidatus Neomarinimicrobiota bacterium]
MIEIRMHGRGGQGAVVACKILASAFFKEGKFAQAFPAFGVERRGAPVMAFIRVDDKPIHLRTEIYSPQHLIILDPTLLQTVDITGGLKPGGTILINSPLSAEDYPQLASYALATVDANAIAVRHGLGSKSSPIVNTAILGAFSRSTGLIGMDALSTTIASYVPLKPEENVAAAQEAFTQCHFTESTPV